MNSNFSLPLLSLWLSASQFIFGAVSHPLLDPSNSIPQNHTHPVQVSDPILHVRTSFPECVIINRECFFRINWRKNICIGLDGMAPNSDPSSPTKDPQTYTSFKWRSVINKQRREPNEDETAPSHTRTHNTQKNCPTSSEFIKRIPTNKENEYSTK